MFGYFFLTERTVSRFYHTQPKLSTSVAHPLPHLACSIVMACRLILVSGPGQDYSAVFFVGVWKRELGYHSLGEGLHCYMTRLTNLVFPVYEHLI